MRYFKFFIAGLTIVLISCNPGEMEKSWMIGPFEKMDEFNPCLLPSDEPTFYCPIREDTVRWEVKDVFNPSTVIKDNLVHMIYRAEDSVGVHNGTSRLGLAISPDGFTFEKREIPVLFPDNDILKRYEWEGGIEDPRIVETNSGTYFMTYTSYDGKTARLCVASSKDLITWTKHGLAFNLPNNPKYIDTWSKSGSIVCERLYDKLIAKKINGKYWMYWGDTDIYLATSDNLIVWEPLEEDGQLKAILSPRPGNFDSDLVEPGPPAILTADGIVLIYNGRNYGENRNMEIENGTYSAGQALFDAADPTKLVDRSSRDFFHPDRDFEIIGQVNKVVFLEGLVPFKGQWLLYYGTADSKIGVATAPMEK